MWSEVLANVAMIHIDLHNIICHTKLREIEKIWADLGNRASWAPQTMPLKILTEWVVFFHKKIEKFIYLSIAKDRYDGNFELHLNSLA